MKIIIVGDGKVGFAIAKQLSKEGYDITIIEPFYYGIIKIIIMNQKGA